MILPCQICRSSSRQLSITSVASAAIAGASALPAAIRPDLMIAESIPIEDLS